MSSLRSAYVYVRDHYAGVLKEIDSGYTFQYDENYLNREDSSVVSLTLPFRKEPIHSKIIFPFFDGLIPEGWLLDVVVRNWKIDHKDRFGLLLVACKDCIGNVSICEEKI